MTDVDVINARFDGIERTVEKIAEGLQTLIRMEERQATQATKLDDMEKRLRRVEFDSAKSGVSVKAWERIAWIIVTAIFALGFGYVKEATAPDRRTFVQASPSASVHVQNDGP